MDTHVAQRRDFHALELRRRRAARLFAAGEILAHVARVLQVSRQSVSRWYQAWRRGGPTALHGAGRAGRKPKLTAAQLAHVDHALREGPRAHGFATDLWTLPRVATVIKRLTGVTYHPGHVWRVLRALDWTLQRPSPTEMLACMWKNPNVYIEGSLYVGQPGTLVIAENPTMLAERFMFGSGYPVVPIGWMKRQYERLGLSGDAADRMWWRNTLTLFGRLS